MDKHRQKSQKNDSHNDHSHGKICKKKDLAAAYNPRNGGTMYTITKNKITNEDQSVYLLYTKKGKKVEIDKVYVSEEKRGQHLASDLMEFAYEYFTHQKYELIGICSYANAWLIKKEGNK